jgi:hypothetical protein
MRKSLRAVAATAAFAATLTVASAVPAHAALYAGDGVWGYNKPAVVTCRYFDAWNQLRTEVPPPVAFAYNRTPGGGNDWQQVRYRLFYVDARTGLSLGSSGWSAFAWARDDAPAQWSGSTHQMFPGQSSIRVDTRIEFYNRYGAYEGYTAHSADRTYFYNGYVTYGSGPLTSCGKTY